MIVMPTMAGCLSKNQILGISDLRVWLDASYDNLTIEPGNKVSFWGDRSGNGNHFIQSNSISQPEYQATGFNSKPTVYFDTNTYLQNFSLFISGQKTFFVVLNAGNDHGVIMLVPNLTPPNLDYIEFFVGDNATYQSFTVFTGSRIGTGLGFTDPGFVNTPGVLMISHVGTTQDPSEYNVKFNNMLKTLNFNGPVGHLYEFAAIGRRPDQDLLYFSGYISEIIIYNRVLTLAEKNSVHNYLKAKWGIS